MTVPTVPINPCQHAQHEVYGAEGHAVWTVTVAAHSCGRPERFRLYCDQCVTRCMNFNTLYCSGVGGCGEPITTTEAFSMKTRFA